MHFWSCGLSFNLKQKISAQVSVKLVYTAFVLNCDSAAGHHCAVCRPQRPQRGLRLDLDASPAGGLPGQAALPAAVRRAEYHWQACPTTFLKGLV